MAARSPSLLPEMIDGNLRGLDKVFAECTWTSVRAFLAQRLCDRDGGFVAARSRGFCFFNCQVRTVLILLSNQKKLWGEPILRSQLQTVTEASCWPRSSISMCETRSKADSTLFETASPGL